MEDPNNKRKRRSRRRRKPRDTQDASASRQTRRKPGGAQQSRKQQAGRSGRDNRSASPRSVSKNQLPPNFIYGINTVAVALETGQLKVLFFDKGRTSERLQHIHANTLAEGIEIRPLAKQGWSRILSSEVHQGIAGMLHEPQDYFVEEIAAEAGDDSCILVLDRVQDPQNMGAVLRTAAACNVGAVVLPKAGGCPITAAVHKASAGQSLRIPIVEDENLARVIDYLKDHGYWVIGCDSAGGEDATTFEFPAKRVIVMGNEAEGMRRLIRESCDYMVRIPMAPSVESLNISVATGIVLYLATADLARAAWDEESANGDSNGEPG